MTRSHPACWQAEIRKRYLELAKETHPDVAQGEADSERFRRINTAYAALSSPEPAEVQPAAQGWWGMQPGPAPSVGAQAWRKQRTAVAGVGVAMGLAMEGKRAEALDIFLQAGQERLPGQGHKAALDIFDACTAWAPSQQPVSHTQARAHAHEQATRTSLTTRARGRAHIGRTSLLSG